MKQLSWINAIAGVWLMIAGFVIGGTAMTGAQMANNIGVGLLLLVTSWWILAEIRSGTAAWFQMWCGIWLIVSPLVLRSGNETALTGNAIIVGLIVLTVGLFESGASVQRPA